MDPVHAPAVSMDTLLANRGWVRSLALSLVRDEQSADDLVQDMWLRTLETPPTRADTAPGWLATVMRNLARDGWRRDGRRAAHEGAVARTDVVPGTVDLVARAEAHRSLIRHVTRLRDPYRTVVLLRFFEDLPPREIARRLGVPPATVRTHLHRALAMLRDSLDVGSGGRDRWAPALLPLPGAVLAKSASMSTGGSLSSALIGGVVVTAKQKLIVAAVLLLLVGGGGAWLAATGSPDQKSEGAEVAAADEDEDARGRRRVAAETSAETPAAEPEPEADPVAEAEAEPSYPADHSPKEHRESISFTVLRYVGRRPVPEGYTELAPGEEPVIEDVGDATGIGSRGPRMLPYWSRWASVPETGTVTIKGRITDASGRGLEGAQVYRAKLDKNGQRASPSSYQWIEEMTTTDPEGFYVGHAQPAGDYLVAADYNATMRRSRGLDLGASTPVSAVDNQTLGGVDLQLPVESARLSILHIVVRDETGKRKRNAEVWGPFQREYTNAHGVAVIGGLAPGTTQITVGATGYATQTFDLDIEPGTEDELLVNLDFAEKGDLELVGRVVDEDGVPVANAPIFMAASFRGSRWAKTDDAGVFRFPKLSRKYEKTEVSVMVSPHPERNAFKALGAPVKTTVPAEGLQLTVQRTTRLHVLLRDKDTGDPLPLYAISSEVYTTRDGVSEWRNYHGMSHYDEDAEAVFKVPKGRFRLTIRAKDHRGVAIEVDVPDTATPKEIRVEMELTAEEE